MNTQIEMHIAQLKRVLPGLAKIVTRSTHLPVLQCVKVCLSQDAQVLTLQAHNLDEVASVRLPHKTEGLPGDMLVPLEMLTKIVKGCSANQSLQLIGTTQQTRIRYAVAGSFVERLLPHVPVQDWPTVKEISREQQQTVDKAFKIALRQAMECASLDDGRPVLNGVCLDVRERDGHSVVGTDGRHLYEANSFQFNLPEPLIIPDRAFLNWPGFLSDGTWKLSMLAALKEAGAESDSASRNDEAAWFQIDSEHWSYLARGADGQYPNWQQVIPRNTSGWTQITLERAAVDSLLQALPLLPGNEEPSEPVTLVVGKGLSVKARATGQTHCTRIEVRGAIVQGPALETTLNRTYLLRALRFGLHRIELHDSLGPLIFTAPGQRMIIMPMRAHNPTDPPSESNEQCSQNEKATAEPPSATEAETPTETRITVSTETIMAAPDPGNLLGHTNGVNGQEQNGEARSGFKAVLQHIDQIKTDLRAVISELNSTMVLLKTAEKEQRASAKEIETVRTKLREIQNVEI
jgi:DNA polymerase III sliding clamp (beta) subunit (PCNA family)